MLISGFTLAFTLGWTMAFAMLLVMPILIMGISVFFVSMGKAAVSGLKSYGQSAGYAEQALSAIRVVTAFGMQETESDTYSRFLEDAKKEGIKSGIIVAISAGFYAGMIYVAYSYAFFLGGHWVDNEYYNSTRGRNYTAGDSITVFFGVIMGLFSIAGIGPGFRAIAEARAAAFLAFETIDRVPIIN
jgi:ABC-type multidrug transport system fused ATPase/permease subunit